MAGSILLVDDDPGVLSTLSRYFQLRDHEVFRAMTGREAAELYDSQRPDVALVDLRLPDLSGLDLLELLHRSGATVIILTGHGDIPTAVQAVKSGAENFLTKPVDLGHLDAVVERALEKSRLKRVQSHLRESPNGSSLAALGSSAQMRELAAQIERVAQSERTTVLLYGESGTGKGWVAERIHRISPRRQAAFVEFNCSTLTGTFLESELFGHEKGAFTDAKALKRGLFEVADRGTIFLDEITDMEPNLQPKLLNVLESRAFRRIGGTREIAVDVRVIAASNTDIQRAVAQQGFREDLFYRLNVMPIELPPLRKRGREDVAELATRILDGLSREFPRGPERMSDEALALLVRYSWPGNVRELRNVLERARILAGDAETLEPSHLPSEIRGSSLSFDSRNDDLPSLEELERRHISRVLLYCGGNRTRAARRLRISRATLHNKINRYGLKTVGLEAG